MKVRRALASDNVTGWALAGPAVFLIFIFGVVPIVWAWKFPELRKVDDLRGSS